VRIGTPASTTRGLKENEMRQIGAWIDEALQNIENPAVLTKIRGEIRELCQQFPLYAHRLV
jgi:glycine hydroxymethyltransferase